MDSYHLPPRRRPERTGASYHNKVLTVAKQDSEGLAWRLPPPVSQVERQARADEGLHHVRLRRAPAPVLFDELIATLMFRQDTKPKVVQEMLGHSSIKTTLDTYTHVIPGMQKEAVERLGELFYSEE